MANNSGSNIPHIVGNSKAKDLAAYNAKNKGALGTDPKAKDKDKNKTKPIAPNSMEGLKDQYSNLQVGAGNAQDNQFKQINSQGQFDPKTMGIQQFQPGDFQQQFQGSYDHALDQFNRSSQPALISRNKTFSRWLQSVELIRLAISISRCIRRKLAILKILLG
jgi:hypothetical protein